MSGLLPYIALAVSVVAFIVSATVSVAITRSQRRIDRQEEA